MSDKCPSIHIWSGQQCIRSSGHDGYCWGKSQQSGRCSITRDVWRSVGGVFKSHHCYDQLYAKNFKVVAEDSEQA